MESELAILDSYIANNNSGGYFANNGWQEIFPEIKPEGIQALLSNELRVFKLPSLSGQMSSYVLTTAVYADDIIADNVVCVWQY